MLFLGQKDAGVILRPIPISEQSIEGILVPNAKPVQFLRQLNVPFVLIIIKWNFLGDLFGNTSNRCWGRLLGKPSRRGETFVEISRRGEGLHSM